MRKYIIAILVVSVFIAPVVVGAVSDTNDAQIRAGINRIINYIEKIKLRLAVALDQEGSGAVLAANTQAIVNGSRDGSIFPDREMLPR